MSFAKETICMLPLQFLLLALRENNAINDHGIMASTLYHNSMVQTGISSLSTRHAYIPR